VKAVFLFVLLFTIALFGCKKNNPVEHKEGEFVGIVKTDSTGVIIKDDPLDWQPRYNSNNGGSISTADSFCFRPAYPNPTTRKSIIPFAVPQMVRGKIILKSSPSTTIETIFDDTLPRGIFQLHFDFTANSLTNKNGIYRFYFEFSSLDSGKILKKSFGDIQLYKP